MTDARFTLIDLPRACARELYGQTVDKVVTSLSRNTFVDSIYQIGSVRHPGISDIDLLVVVDDAARSDLDPRDHLTDVERYLFAHSCFLIPSSLAPALSTYASLGGYQRLYGASWSWEAGGNGPLLDLARQDAALEFIVKNLLDLYVQAAYGVVKVRALLQHVKGLSVDIDVLEVPPGPLSSVVDSTNRLVDTWFDVPTSARRVDTLVAELLPALRDAVVEVTERTTLFYPGRDPVRLARNMRLRAGASVTMQRRGIRLPAILGLTGRRHFNAQHRTNRFAFTIPMSPVPANSYHADRFDFFRRSKSFVTTRFPSYSAPIPPLFYNVL